MSLNISRHDKNLNNKVLMILNKALHGGQITKKEAKTLLNVDVYSKDMYNILACANVLSRKHFKNLGEIYAQIGLNNSPCSKNCNFCFFGEKHGLIKEIVNIEEEEIYRKVDNFIKSGVTEVFLMATADYDFEKFLAIGRKVRKIIPKEMKLVANLGDFNREMACELKKIGFTGAYHICRLREGEDTDIPKEERISTLSIIQQSDLELYYCVEPIGPEHTIDEIVEEIFRGLEYDASVMAVMRRIPVKGTPLEKAGQISELELSKICAVTRLAAGDSIRAMGVHEPSLLSLVGGANQIYAEKGCNPRDLKKETSDGRGFSAAMANKMLLEAGWEY
ncbi:radical SAM protein [Maledivibacter halophilus]|uniref:Biotin synthase n=1 Tax=Maledivibacter halophilus TaxID=36842 RepID=A0A1T5IL85_9FIRM|nr:radical SAM protein [Maledivibacter halophilus]SKC39758.1 biotin synthase [Maledivibacter halophilus]